MYAADDPRSKLASASPKKATPLAFHDAQRQFYYEDAPQESSELGRVWYARGQNLVTVYADVKAGYSFKRAAQIDEYVVLIPDRETKVRVAAENDQQLVDGNSVVMVPPGRSEVEVLADGVIVILATTRSADLVARCANAASYAAPDPNVADFEAWPPAREAGRIHAYSLDVPPEEGRFGRIFRCSTVMVNCFEPAGPRPVDKMSPHHHDDFEQYSLVLNGEFTHYLRWPWNTDMNSWKEDEAVVCGGPSVTVIPPPVIHTTRAAGPSNNIMVDVFSPPRHDFAQKAGWVLNEGDYQPPA